MDVVSSCISPIGLFDGLVIVLPVAAGAELLQNLVRRTLFIFCQTIRLTVALIIGTSA